VRSHGGDLRRRGGGNTKPKSKGGSWKKKKILNQRRYLAQPRKQQVIFKEKKGRETDLKGKKRHGERVITNEGVPAARTITGRGESFQATLKEGAKRAMSKTSEGGEKLGYEGQMKEAQVTWKRRDILQLRTRRRRGETRPVDLHERRKSVQKIPGEGNLSRVECRLRGSEAWGG